MNIKLNRIIRAAFGFRLSNLFTLPNIVVLFFNPFIHKIIYLQFDINLPNYD